MKIIEVKYYAEGLKQIYIDKFHDDRGCFLKTFNSEIKQIFDDFFLVEEFFSISKKNVIRGMHFQIPPFDHNKLVTCINGSFLDIVVDIKKSRDFGKFYEFDMNSKSPSILMIGRGYAHGFLSKEDNSIMSYMVDSEYEPSHDNGIKWNSFQYNWNVSDPIISRRDNNFIDLNSFDSPFI